MKIFYSEEFLRHKTEEHPERPERLLAAKKSLEPLPIEWQEPILADKESLHLVHSSHMVDEIMQACIKGEGWFDPDTYYVPASWTAALMAAGAAMEAAEHATGFKDHAFALVRPPGHHAGINRPGGFCLINNIAVAARVVRHQEIVDRVAIFDFDLHHGNGTQEIFWDDPSVLYVSIHQSPGFPGTGHRDETGGGKAKGTKMNFPLLTASDNIVKQLWIKDIEPAIINFDPGLILVSAGFDGHYMDPLGSFEYTEDLYAFLGRELRKTAQKLNAGLAGCLEGGYNLEALGNSIRAFLEPWTIF